jgi:hypothetical protein
MNGAIILLFPKRLCFSDVLEESSMRGALLLTVLASAASLGASQSVDVGKQIYSSS